MPFITAARNFLAHPETIRTSPRKRGIAVDTVQFLLDNEVIGHENAINTDVIIEHLATLGHTITRNQWETDILGLLIENSVWIGSRPGNTGGIFIIQNQEDVDIVKATYGKKALTMIRRYRLLEQLEGQLPHN